MSAIKGVQDVQLNYLISKIKAELNNKVTVVSGKGLSANDFTTELKTKLEGISAGAEVNQNAFSKLKVGSVLVEADTKTDTVEFVAGNNVTITPDAANDRVTIAATDTTYTFATGSTNGTIAVATNGANAKDVAVKGLGSAAYTESSAYDVAGAAGKVLGTSTDASTANTVYGAKAAAAAAQTTANNAMPKSGGNFTGFVALHANPTQNSHAANKSYVDAKDSEMLTAAKSDAQSKADTALDAAKAYADTQDSDMLAAAKSDAQSKADIALNAAKAYADTKTAGLTGAMHYKGALDALPTDNTNYTSGDVIIVSSKEYVFDGTTWHELGDEGSHVLKTQKINGHALSGDITLTPADIGADAAGTAANLINSLDYTYSGSGNYVTGVSQTNGKVSITKGTLPTALPNPNALKFGSKTYNGSAAATITAADLGALTEHQDISGKQDVLAWVTNDDIDAMFAGTYTAS